MKKLFEGKLIKRLDRYIITKFLGTYVFAIALIISIAVVFDFNEKVGNDRRERSRIILSNNDIVYFFYFFQLF